MTVAYIIYGGLEYNQHAGARFHFGQEQCRIV